MLIEFRCPKASLERHLRKCHGEQRLRPIHNAAFYYGSNVGGHADKGGNDSVEEGVEDDQDSDRDGELQSLLEPDVLQNEEREANADQEEGLIAAIAKTATSADSFYEHVRRWKRIPRAFATMKDEERELVTSASLHRWLNSELRRPGVLPSDEPLDEELVEYVAGLLDHPDFCKPDLLALELHEFLGGGVTSFVLALWKFLIVEMGLHSVFKSDRSGVNNVIQASSTRKNQPTAQENISKTSPTIASAIDEGVERDYKRRRASYRGKIGTKTGPAALRELIQKHMVGLSVEMDRELVLGGGFQEEREGKNNHANKSSESRPDSVKWRDFADALEVRNRNRPEGREQSKRHQSRSRSLGRLSAEVDSVRRSKKRGRDSDEYRRRSPQRHCWRSRSRSRGRSPRRQRRRDSDRSKSERTRSTRMLGDRSEVRRSDCRY